MCSLTLLLCSILCLLVSPNGTVVVMPTRQTLSNNGRFTFSCMAEGGPSNVFQWSFGSVNLPGENGTSLTVRTVDAADGGTYTCTVRNQAGVDQDMAELFGECHKSLLLGVFTPSI